MLELTNVAGTSTESQSLTGSSEPNTPYVTSKTASLNKYAYRAFANMILTTRQGRQLSVGWMQVKQVSGASWSCLHIQTQLGLMLAEILRKMFFFQVTPRPWGGDP